jgi:hypothetical protein
MGPLGPRPKHSGSMGSGNKSEGSTGSGVLDIESRTQMMSIGLLGPGPMGPLGSGSQKSGSLLGLGGGGRGRLFPMDMLLEVIQAVQ